MSGSGNRIRVLHLIDTLDVGGAERVAVNLVNILPRERYLTHLCTTRRDGPLETLLASDVKKLRLERKHRFSLRALQQLVSFIRSYDIQIMHAHSSSIFIAALASLFPPFPAVVWHDHYGRHELENRPVFLYSLASRRVKGVIAVSKSLAEWSCQRMHIPSHRVWYIPNFVSQEKRNTSIPDLPGIKGQRIVCVANLRPQKDHLTLLRAMAQVIQQVPEAHLLLVGAEGDLAFSDSIKKEITKLGIFENVSLLGRRLDVFEILMASDIGVLSSGSEGLPLSLLEYGLASLPVVATNVGQCAEVLGEGQDGLIVSPGAPDELAKALLSLLQSLEQRAYLSERFHRRVKMFYSPGPVVKQISHVYDTVLRLGKV